MTSLVILCLLLLAIVITLLVMVFTPIQLRMKKCYRCALPAEEQFMNLDYCHICRMVVIAMYPAVSQDPPFGFPGQKGYDPFGEDPYLKRREDDGLGKKD